MPRIMKAIELMIEQYFNPQKKPNPTPAPIAKKGLITAAKLMKMLADLSPDAGRSHELTDTEPRAYSSVIAIPTGNIIVSRIPARRSSLLVPDSLKRKFAITTETGTEAPSTLCACLELGSWREFILKAK